MPSLSRLASTSGINLWIHLYVKVTSPRVIIFPLILLAPSSVSLFLSVSLTTIFISGIHSAKNVMEAINESNGLLKYLRSGVIKDNDVVIQFLETLWSYHLLLQRTLQRYFNVSNFRHTH